MLIVSCYTPDYEKHAQGLRRNLTHHGADFCVRRVKCRGSWLANTWHKPRFIREMLDQAGGPICWIDADARLHRRPEPMEQIQGEPDIALVPEWRSYYGWFYYDSASSKLKQRGGEKPHPLCRSGTIYLANNDRTRYFLRLWQGQEKGCIAAGTPDQAPLGWAAWEAGLRVAILPLSYCCIFDSDREHVAEPVIVHYQASRRLRKKVGA